MRTFWEDLSKRIGETAESVSNKAGEAVEIQKLKSQIRALERGTEEDLIDLGRMVYEYFEAGNLVGSEAEGLCEAIRSRKQSIEDYEKRIIAVRGEFSCKNCGKTISNKMAYCPYCGEKMEAEATAEDENRQAKDAEADVIDYADVMRAKAEEAANAVENAAEKVDDLAKKATDKVEDFGGRTADKVEDLAEKAAVTVENAAEKTVEKAKEAAEKLRGEEE
ncbi:hypothetical protein F230042K4_22180 [Mediterraneibacter glycyrrhizinilyticus]|uniref:zinc ribbon domain-containing protein n=1 Tax=Mediterraneibacter glycyrrhizinilyticus TaxID=342942 RepID=UPI0036F1D6D2